MNLTRSEQRIAEVIAKAEGKVVRMDAIRSALGLPLVRETERTDASLIRTHICRVNRKLGKRIANRRGLGYVWK